MRLSLITLLLEIGKDAESHIQHILLRPNQPAIGRHITVVIAARSRKGERNLIFIIVILIVTTQTDEDSQLPILQVGSILLQGIGMGKHLDTLILTEVESSILVYRLGFSTGQIPDNKAQSLLVGFNQLWLTRILLTTDAWRQDVIDRSLLGIFLKIHGTSLQGSTRSSTQLLIISTPFTTYQVERTKAQNDRLLETRKEHTHETDAGEIIDITLPALELIYRNTELIPGNRRLGIVSPGL